MKTIPIYVVTGFLSTGKTAFINQMLHKRRENWPVLAQFEEGMQVLTLDRTGESTAPIQAQFATPTTTMTKEDWKQIAQQIRQLINGRNADELWIEWNGMTPFSVLEHLCYETELAEVAHLEQIFYVTTPDYTTMMLGKTGEANLSQLANADVAVIMGVPDGPSSNAYQATKKRLLEYHPQLSFYRVTQPFPKKDTQKRSALSFIVFASAIAYLGIFYGVPLLYGPQPISPSLLKLEAIFTGIFLQAFPFLLLGVLVSSALQFFLAPAYVQRFLTGNPIKSYLFALLGGFFFPVCDCSTIPIFRSLVLRNVPIPVGMTFMLSSPIINPIVLLSTYYAFGGDWRMVLGRFGLGALTAILVSITFMGYRGLASMQRTDMQVLAFQQRYLVGNMHRVTKTKWQGFLTHSQGEAFKMGAYLLVGSLLSAAFQVYVSPQLQAHHWSASLPVAILFMMAFAFFLSLCSTSDAMIARSLGSTFAMPTLMGFMLFGPMIDLKNVFLLTSLFPKRFVLRLGLTVAVIVFGCAVGFSYIWPYLPYVGLGGLR